MEFYTKKNGEYDRLNAQNYEHPGVRSEQKSIEYYESVEGSVEEEEELEVEEVEDTEEVNDEEEVVEAEYFEHKEDTKESNEVHHLSYEKSNEYDDYCAKCYKIKDIAGDKWEKSNELADAARQVGIQAKRTEDKANYYKKLAAEESENANKLWAEYRGISSESIELMREARKYMTKFEECLQECDNGESKCDSNKVEERKYESNRVEEQKIESNYVEEEKSDFKPDNRPKLEYRPKLDRRPKPNYGPNNSRR